MLKLIESIIIQLFKLIKFVFRLIFPAVVIYLFVGWNLNRHSLYYAQYTPHSKESDPVLMTVVDKLWWIDRPILDGIIYDFDGTPAIIAKSNEFSEIQPFFEKSSDGYGYLSSSDIIISFNKKFELTFSSDRNQNKVDLNSTDQASLRKEMHQFIQPIVDYQSPPLINLQRIFDWYYHDKFN